MKKIILILAVLVLAVPVMAVHTNVTATITQVGITDEFDVIVTWSGGGSPPRAFAIDVNVGSGRTITEVSGYHTGESNKPPGSKGFGIFPASFARAINTDFNNWDDVNYTPVAHPNDFPGDTLDGIGTGGVTLELGSLYVGGPNKPTSPSTLARIRVSGSCNMCIATNVSRGKIVLEDGNEPNEPSGLSMGCTALTFCPVPYVVGDTNALAQGVIVGASLTIGNITPACSATIADGNVISTDPVAGVFPGCGTPVDIVLSKGPPPTVPNVEDMNEADAIATINAVANLSAGTVSYDCNDVEEAGQVLRQSPGAGGAACDTIVDIVVSTGSPTVPNVLDMNETEAIAAINAVVGLTVGTTYDCNDVEAVGEVLSQSPGAGASTCGTTVDLVVSMYPPCWGWPTHCYGNAIDVGGGPAGFVDLDDFWEFSDSFYKNYRDHPPANAENPQPGEYNPCADWNDDGIVDLDDFWIFSDWFYYEYPDTNCVTASWPPPTTGY